MLCDRIVCSINNSRIQQKLLSEKKLTLTTAIETAQAIETASKNDKELAQQETAQPVESVHRGKDTRSIFCGTCFCCGKVGHKREKCRLKDVTCRGCGRKGHIQHICRSKPVFSHQPRPTGKGSVHHLEESSKELSGESGDDHHLYAIISSSKPQPFRVDIIINYKLTTMEIDTGASLTLVSECTLHDLWPDTCVTPSKVKLHSYSGETIPVLGNVDVLVKYGHQSASLPLLVVKGAGSSLLSRNWLGVIKLDWHEIFWLQNASLAELLDKHKAEFEPDLGKVTGYDYCGPNSSSKV